MIRDKRRIDPETGDVRQPAGAPPAGTAPTAPPAGTASGDAASWSAASAALGDSAELEELRIQLAERTADLQRVTAEYANYRKRVDRDRVAVVDTATASVIGSLLPVLDDLDRAAEHGDLTGPFKAVADQLQAILGKIGLESFGSAGDPFDPIVHEAVMHSTSTEVSQPTAVQVMRRGYRHGERLIRPAMVAVAEPAHDAPTEEVPEAGWTVPGTDPDGEPTQQ